MIRELVGHSATYTLANLISRGTVLVWLIVLPRFMSSADYGALGLILTTAALFNLVPLEIGQALGRYYPAADGDEKGNWASTAWIFTLSTLTLVAMIALIFSQWLNRQLLGDDSYGPAFRIALAYFVLNSSFLFAQNLFRWAFRSRDYALATTASALVTLFLSIGLAAILSNALTGVLAGLVAGAVIGLSLAIARLGPVLRNRIDLPKLGRMLRFSLPLVPASLALLLSTYASRFILNDLLTLKDVGMFTWASQLAAVPALLLLGVQGAVTPLVIKHHAATDTPVVLARSFETIFSGALGLCIALGLYTPELVRLLGYSQFAGAAPLVMLLAPAMLLLQLYVFAPGFAVAERTGLQLFVSALGAVAAILFNYMFINAVGLIGAAIATLGSSLVFTGSWFLLSNRLYPIPAHWLRLGLLVAGAAACATVGTLAVPNGIPQAILFKALLLAVLAALAAYLGFARIWRLKQLIAQGPRLSE